MEEYIKHGYQPKDPDRNNNIEPKPPIGGTSMQDETSEFKKMDKLTITKEVEYALDYLFEKFAGHSIYSGDSVLSAIEGVKEGKAICSVTPLEKDDRTMKKEKKDILIAPTIGYYSWLCRRCYSRITEGQKVCDCCGYGIRWS